MVMGMIVLHNSMEHIFLTNTGEMMMMMMISSLGDTPLGIRLSICHTLMVLNFLTYLLIELVLNDDWYVIFIFLYFTLIN